MEPTSSNSFGTPVYGSAGAGTVVPVGKGTRFGEAFIDGILLNIVSSAAGYALGSVMGAASTGLAFAIGLVLQFAYYYFQERSSGQTLGKKLLGTRAVMADGSPLTDDAVLKRSLWRLIPLIDALTFLFSDVGWHDRFSGTTVVSTK